MFCERTVINIGHVACQWWRTAFSRRRPLSTRTAACSRTMPLASDAVAFFCLSSLGTRNLGTRALEYVLSLEWPSCWTLTRRRRHAFRLTRLFRLPRWPLQSHTLFLERHILAPTCCLPTKDGCTTCKGHSKKRFMMHLFVQLISIMSSWTSRQQSDGDPLYLTRGQSDDGHVYDCEDRVACR